MHLFIHTYQSPDPQMLIVCTTKGYTEINFTCLHMVIGILNICKWNQIDWSYKCYIHISQCLTNRKSKEIWGVPSILLSSPFCGDSTSQLSFVFRVRPHLALEARQSQTRKSSPDSLKWGGSITWLHSDANQTHPYWRITKKDVERSPPNDFPLVCGQGSWLVTVHF